MNPNNTGSFGSAIGGADSLKAAMQRRGMDSSILDQVSPTSPGGASQIAPSLPSSEGDLASSVASNVVAPSGAKPSTPFRSAEMEISLKALKSVVDTESKIAELSLGLR
jgi:hypothetical protein